MIKDKFVTPGTTFGDFAIYLPLSSFEYFLPQYLIASSQSSLQHELFVLRCMVGSTMKIPTVVPGHGLGPLMSYDNRIVISA